MLRECLRFEALAKIVLHSNHFFDFFKYVEVSTFDIASDAFATFKEIIQSVLKTKTERHDTTDARHAETPECWIIEFRLNFIFPYKFGQMI